MFALKRTSSGDAPLGFLRRIQKAKPLSDIEKVFGPLAWRREREMERGSSLGAVRRRRRAHAKKKNMKSESHNDEHPKRSSLVKTCINAKFSQNEALFIFLQ
jgi:hypothetical protein